MRVFFGAMLVYTLLLYSNALNASSLTPDGVNLGRIDVAALSEALQININLDGDKPIDTFVVARFQNNKPRQRREDGFWVPWDGHYTTLLNNTVERSRTGQLIFSITNEELSEQFLPIIFTIGYNTENQTKSGFLVVDK